MAVAVASVPLFAPGARPQLSVLIGAYNGAATLGATLASVRLQDVEDLEVLVVDGGSSDSTVALVEAAARQDSRIRLIRSEGRLAPPATRNLGLAAVRAPLVATLDQDDLMVRGRLRRQLAALAAEPQLQAVGGRLEPIDRAGLPVAAPADLALMPLAPVAVRYALPLACAALASTTLYRTEALRAVGGFAEDHPLCDDYWMLWQLCRRGDVRVLPEVVCRYRCHAGQLSRLQRYPQVLEVARLRQTIAAEGLGRRPDLVSVLAWARPRLGLTPSQRARAVAELGAWGEAFLRREAPGTAERAWIQADLVRRQRLLEPSGG
jgi:glycosyltransferase involved in cell wall biosynthesis